MNFELLLLSVLYKSVQNKSFKTQINLFLQMSKMFSIFKVNEIIIEKNILQIFN